jgi:hypothetical protein
MRARARTDSRIITLFFLLVMAVSGVWEPSSAGATGESDLRPSRGPKRTERSCSTGESREQDGDNGSSRNHRLGYRHRSAATVQPAANSGRDSRSDCPDDEPRAAASGDGEQADDRWADPSASDSPEPPDSGSEGEARAPGSPASGVPSGSTADAGSGAGRGADSDGPSGARSQALDTGRSGAPPGHDASAPSSSGNTNAGGAGSGGASGGGSSRGSSGGARGAFSGGRGRGTGGGSSPSGSAGAGPGGTKRGPAPSGGTGGPAGFRVAPAGPPSGRNRLAVGVAVPAIAWGSLRAPKAALTSSPGILNPAVALPSTAAAAAAVGPPGPLPRTGSELSPSALLALVLLVVGRVLRRTAR